MRAVLLCAAFSGLTGLGLSLAAADDGASDAALAVLGVGVAGGRRSARQGRGSESPAPGGAPSGESGIEPGTAA
jgi:hypothetical protein